MIKKRSGVDESELEKNFLKRDRVKRRRMKVSGAGVKKLQRIIIGKI